MEMLQNNKPITYDELYAKVTKFIKKVDELDVINAAYGFALEKHSGRKRINGDEAEAIVNNRVALDEKYKTNPHDTDGIREVGTHLGRRWDDAKMVYGEALDGRSLGKDAALAAAGTAALVGGGIALKKHLKKKKQEKELAENKYKTSDKKKKK